MKKKWGRRKLATKGEKMVETRVLLSENRTKMS